MKDKDKKVKKVLLDLLFLNILVSLAKIIYGSMTNLSSMLADGIHSLSDGASNIIGIIGINIASKPADKKHPYGHQKVETLTTIIISFSLFMVSGKLLLGAYDKFLNPTKPEVTTTSFVVMISTLLINIFVTKYEYKKGVMLKSSILISDSQHTLSDVMTSTVVIIGLIGIKLGFTIVDPILSVVISLVIMKAGYDILRDAIDVLIDAQVIDIEIVRNIVMKFDDVIDCHEIRTRGKKDNIMIDLHIIIDSNTRIDDAHRLAHDIEDKIQEEIEEVYEVIVHPEPDDGSYSGEDI